MIGYILTISIITIGLVAALTSPWWGPYAERGEWRDRIQDRVEAEWNRPIETDDYDVYDENRRLLG